MCDPVSNQVRTIKASNQLPEEKAEEISHFAEFMMNQFEEQQLTNGVQQMTADSQALNF